MKIAGGIHGDIATASIVVNSIPKVLAASPGLHTMRDLPLPSFFPGADSQHGHRSQLDRELDRSKLCVLCRTVR